jgi:hypothetical protein
LRWTKRGCGGRRLVRAASLDFIVRSGGEGT